jgi:hypothetical protein
MNLFAFPSSKSGSSRDRTAASSASRLSGTVSVAGDRARDRDDDAPDLSCSVFSSAEFETTGSGESLYGIGIQL